MVEEVEEVKLMLTEYFSHEKFLKIAIMCFNILLIYALLMAVVYLERKMFKRIIARRDRQSTDKTNLIFIRNVVIYTTYCIGFLSMLNQIPSMEQLSKTLLTGAGILAAAVGFGSQQAISNIVSGIFMVLFKPFRVGDHIDLGGVNKGTVIDISLRHTIIRNSENRIIVIPNTVLNNQSIVNSTIVSTTTCTSVNVSINYKSNVNRAMEIMQEEALKHPLLIEHRTPADIKKGTPRIIVRLIEWERSSITLQTWVWASSSGNAFALKCDLLKAIKERFDNENIEIPLQYIYQCETELIGKR